MEIAEALRIALDYEHKVRDHYRKGAAEILDERGRKVFETLAREEQGHVNYLASRLDEWKRTGHVEDVPLETILPPADWAARSAAGRAAQDPDRMVALGTEMELLKTALELEHATSGFYRELVGTLAPADRGLFERFLEIEQGHVAIVQAEIDSLAGHGHWFDVMEFSLEAG